MRTWKPVVDSSSNAPLLTSASSRKIDASTINEQQTINHSTLSFSYEKANHHAQALVVVGLLPISQIL
jgi:hypothetical protein